MTVYSLHLCISFNIHVDEQNWAKKERELHAGGLTLSFYSLQTTKL